MNEENVLNNSRSLPIDSSPFPITQNALTLMHIKNAVELGPVNVQVLDFRKLPCGQTARYRILLNDGSHFAYGIISSKLNEYFENNLLDRKGLIKVVNWLCNDIQNKKTVFLLNFEVLHKALKERLGNPISLPDNIYSEPIVKNEIKVESKTSLLIKQPNLNIVHSARNDKLPNINTIISSTIDNNCPIISIPNNNNCSLLQFPVTDISTRKLKPTVGDINFKFPPTSKVIDPLAPIKPITLGSCTVPTSSSTTSNTLPKLVTRKRKLDNIVNIIEKLDDSALDAVLNIAELFNAQKEKKRKVKSTED